MRKVQVQQVDNQCGAVMEKFQYLNFFIVIMNFPLGAQVENIT